MNALFNDWRFWLFTVSVVKDFILVLGIILVKFNDLKHLNADMTKTTKILAKMEKRLNSIEKNQTAMQAVCNERHSKK